MRKEDVFPSKYLRAEDLKNRAHLVTISHINMEPFTDDRGRSVDKPVVYFQGKEKGMVTNVTNWGAIAYLLGEESDEWNGGKIVIAPELVAFKGQMKLSIRVKPPNGAGPKKPPLQNTENPAAPIEAVKRQQIVDPDPNAGAYDDEIPF